MKISVLTCFNACDYHMVIWDKVKWFLWYRNPKESQMKIRDPLNYKYNAQSCEWYRFYWMKFFLCLDSHVSTIMDGKYAHYLN